MRTQLTRELIELDKAHLLHPVSNLRYVQRHGALPIARGRGIYVWDTDGNRYIDGFAGLWNVNVGHGRRELADVMATQAEELYPTFSGLANPPAIQLAAKLAHMLPSSLNHIHFTSGGGESNESAFKIARYFWHLQGKPKKTKVLSRKMAYHGIATGTLAATGIPAFHAGFGAPAPGFVHLTAPYHYRDGQGLSDEAFVAKLVTELEETIAREGAETIAAFIGEPVQGAGGVIVPPEGYWPALAAVLKRHQILLILDEIITGFGRVGAMFGMQHYGVVPDIATFAKGITSGYVPLGAVAVSDALFEAMTKPDQTFMHGFTYSGHPVSCAVALRNLQIIEDERLPENAKLRGAQLLSALREQLASHPHVGEVRGMGLMVMIELVADRSTRARFGEGKTIVQKARRRVFGPRLDVVRMRAAIRARGAILRESGEGIYIAPPLVISSTEVDELVDITVAAVADVLG